MSSPTRYDIFDPTVPVLEFRLASFDAADGFRVGRERINFTLRSGELMLIRVAAGDAGDFRLADAAEGLLKPGHGDVLYRGTDWSRLRARAAERRRGEIGRVFLRSPWVSNLDVDENVMLRLRHHAFQSRRAIAARARDAAAAFGVDALPALRPEQVSAQELQVAQWIRAFAGEPALVLLEHPVTSDALPVARLVDAVRATRARGGAIVWMTSREDVWEDQALEPRQRFVVDDASLRACKEDG